MRPGPKRGVRDKFETENMSRAGRERHESAGRYLNEELIEDGNVVGRHPNGVMDGIADDEAHPTGFERSKEKVCVRGFAGAGSARNNPPLTTDP